MKQLFENWRGYLNEQEDFQGFRLRGEPMEYIEGNLDPSDPQYKRRVIVVDTPEGPVSMYASSGQNTPGITKRGDWTPFYGLQDMPDVQAGRLRHTGQGHPNLWFAKGAQDAQGNPIDMSSRDAVYKKAPHPNSREGRAARYLQALDAEGWWERRESEGKLPKQYDIDSQEGIQRASRDYADTLGDDFQSYRDRSMQRTATQRVYSPDSDIYRAGKPGIAYGADYTNLPQKSPILRGGRRGSVDPRIPAAGVAGLAGAAIGAADFPDTQSGRELDTARNVAGAGAGAAGLARGVASIGAGATGAAAAGGALPFMYPGHVVSGLSNVPGVGKALYGDDAGMSVKQGKQKWEDSTKAIGNALTKGYDAAASYIPGTRQYDRKQSSQGVAKELDRLTKQQNQVNEVKTNDFQTIFENWRDYAKKDCE